MKSNSYNSLNNDISYQKVSSDQEFNESFKSQFNLKNILKLDQVLDVDTSNKINELCQKDENLKLQMDALLRYMSMDKKSLKSGEKLSSKSFINSKLVGAGPLASTMGELMVVVKTSLPDELSQAFYDTVLSNVENYPALQQQKQSKFNPSWWDSSFESSKNIKKHFNKLDKKITSCSWDNPDYIKEKYGEETHNKIYGKSGTTADMFVQTSDGELFPVSLKKGGGARLGTMSPGKITKKLIQPYDLGGSKYIVTQRKNLWQNFFKQNDINKHFNKVADKVEDMTQLDFMQAQKYKKDFYAILKILKSTDRLDELRNIKSMDDLTDIMKKTPKYAKKHTRGKYKLLMNSIDIQMQQDPKCKKIFNDVVDVAKNSANKMIQVLFKDQKGKKMITKQIQAILPFQQIFQKGLIIASPDGILSTENFKRLGIDSYEQLNQNFSIQTQDDGSTYVNLLISKKGTKKNIKLAKINAIQSGVGYANQIVCPIQIHKEIHQLYQVSTNK